MKEKIKKYWWIGLLLIIWIIVVFFLKKPGEEKKNENEVPMTIPTIIVTPGPTIFTGGTGPSKEEAEKITEERRKIISEQPLWEKMPYQGEGWRADHYIAELKVVIYIEEGIDREKVTKEFDKWLEQNGFKAGSHQVEWRLKEKK